MALDWSKVCFAACLMANMVDVMGTLFTAPVLVPYGQSLGATTAEIASFTTVRFGLGIVSLIWMPRLADARGTKICILVSVLGSAVAYGIQGNSHLLTSTCRDPFSLDAGQSMDFGKDHGCNTVFGDIQWDSSGRVAVGGSGGGGVDCPVVCTDDKSGVIFMLIGRALAGFFGGTQPILRSYISQISLPNMAVLKLRMTLLFASFQAGAFALSPIAGVISQFGLFWPWYVSAGTALLVFAFVAFFFVNAEALKAAAPETEKAMISEKSDVETPSLWKDKILWLLLLAYLSIFMTVSALLLLLPLLLEYPNFGLLDSDLKASRERLASATSMAMIPHGVMNLCFSTVGFLIISNKIGDRWTARIGATIATAVLCLYGYASSEVWHLLVLHGGMGIGLGLFVPAIGPTLQRYTTLAHPKKAAQASALPLFGMQIGQVVGQPMYSAVIGEGQERWRMDMAWIIAGACFALGAVLADLALTLIHRHPVMKRLQYTPEQIKIMVETGAKDREIFVEEMCKKLRGMLTEGDPDYRGAKLFSGVAQRFIERVIDRSIPKLREDPEEHLEDVADWLERVGTAKELEYFYTRFPQLRRRLAQPVPDSPQ